MVDDNAMNRKVVTALLKETAVQIGQADCGRSCLELVRKEQFDLILLDHMMPDMDGFDTLRQIREQKDGLCRETPVIAFTANCLSGAKERYEQKGFAGVLSKPVIPEELEDALLRYLPKELLLDQKNASRATDPDSGKGYEEEAELPYVHGMDWAYARLHFPDEKLLKLLVKDFYRDTDTYIAEIRTLADAVENGAEVSLYQTRVYALKSTAALIGAVPVSGLAKILEYAADAGETEKIRQLTPVLLEELERCKEKLSFLETEEKETENTANSSVLLSLLEILHLALLEMDIDGADAAMKRIQDYTYEGKMEEKIEKIGSLVNALQLEQAQKLTEDMIAALSSERSGE